MGLVPRTGGRVTRRPKTGEVNAWVQAGRAGRARCTPAYPVTPRRRPCQHHRRPAGRPRLRRAQPLQLRLVGKAQADRLLRLGRAARGPPALDPSAGHLCRAHVGHRDVRLRPRAVRAALDPDECRDPHPDRAGRRVDGRRVHGRPSAAAPGRLRSTARSAARRAQPGVVHLRLRAGGLVGGRRLDRPSDLPQGRRLPQRTARRARVDDLAAVVQGGLRRPEHEWRCVRGRQKPDLVDRPLVLRPVREGVSGRRAGRPTAEFRRGHRDRIGLVAVGHHVERDRRRRRVALPGVPPDVRRRCSG